MKLLILFLFQFVIYTTTAQINGKLINEETKEVIPFATVRLTDLKIATLTNEQGIFRFDITPPNTFVLAVSAFGFEPYIETFQLSNDTLIITLKETHVELENIEILASRNGIQRDNITYIERKSLNELNTIKTTNLGEAVANMTGVYNASTGAGISKPVIRGLSGTRIITMLNGTRIENQQWGSDHGMAVTSLGIGSVEVVKGPASLLYGSDALGGVIYFNDEDYAAHKSVETQLSSAFETNGSNLQNQFGVKLSGQRLRMNAYIGWNSAANMQLSNKLFLANSMYDDKIAKLAFGFGKGNWISNVRYNFLLSKVGIPGETEDTLPTLNSYLIAKNERTTQTPFQHITNHILTWENKFFHKNNVLSILIGSTYNRLQEFEDSYQESALDMKLLSLPYTIKHDWKITKHIIWTNGIQGMYQQNRNSELAEEKLIPNSNTSDNGIFSLFVWNNSKTKYQAGLRGDVRYIDVKDDSIFFKNSFPSLNFSVGIIHQFSTKQQIRLNIASGFRSPHTSELLARGAHDGALRYELGSSTLKNEQAFQADFTYEINSKHFSFFVNPFYNHIKDYIALNRIDSLIDNLPVFQYKQLANTYFFGTDLAFHIHPHFAHWLHIESSYSFIRGQEKSGTSLPLIPAGRILNTIRLEINKGKHLKWSTLALQLNYFFKQTRIGENEKPTMDFGLINLGTTFMYNEFIELSIGVKNITNQRYFNNLSPLRNIGVPQSGINGYIQLIFKLQHKMG